MIIKTAEAIDKMYAAGQELAAIFEMIPQIIAPGITTLDINTFVEQELMKRNLVSQSKGYHGYKHVSCISVNDVVVHGVPTASVVLQKNDIVKVDVCAALNGYCADMARVFVVGNRHDLSVEVQKFMTVAQLALDKGIAVATKDHRLFDISATIGQQAKQHGYGIVQEFAGHGIGKKMHEQPDVPNFGEFGTGARLKPGMVFALEPMFTMSGNGSIYITTDGWTVKTKDGSLAMHVEDTVAITDHGPKILTRLTA